MKAALGRPGDAARFRLRCVPSALLAAVSIIVCTCSPASSPAESQSAGSFVDRIACRSFPSIFQAWTRESDPDLLSQEEKLARHDLIWEGLTDGASDVLGIKWTGYFAGLATTFQSGSLTRASIRRAELLRENPNVILILELRVYDAPSNYLPVDSGWWKRDGKGERIVSYRNAGNTYYLLDWQNSDFRATLAAQTHAVSASGTYDGVMLDSYEHYAHETGITQLVRRVLGANPLILVNYRNPNGGKHNIVPVESDLAPLINGQFLENLDASQPDARLTLTADERDLRMPRIEALEMQTNDINNLKFVRMATTLLLTHSNGYVLIAIRNGNPILSDHVHRWYEFWDRKVGGPVGDMTRRADGAIQREYSNGSVVYNPETNGHSVTITFSSTRTSAATGRSGMSFAVDPDDGDMFLDSASSTGRSRSMNGISNHRCTRRVAT
jgi:hypothetical protein